MGEPRTPVADSVAAIEHAITNAIVVERMQFHGSHGFSGRASGDEKAEAWDALREAIRVELERIAGERDALLVALHEQGCPSWGRQRNGVYSGCGKCVACRADEIVMNAATEAPTPILFGHDGTTGGNDDPNG